MERRSLQITGVGCTLLAILVCPHVLGPIAATDGHISSRINILVLWLVTLLLTAAGLLLIWAARTDRHVGRLARRQVRLRLEKTWRVRYWLAAASVGTFCTIAISFLSYAHWVNHVDLVGRLNRSHPVSQTILKMAETEGKSSALGALTDTFRSRPATIRLTPYQLWDMEPDFSSNRQRAFLEGDLTRATGRTGKYNVRWRPGEPLPWDHRDEVMLTFDLQRQGFLLDVLRNRDAKTYPAALAAAKSFVTEWRRTNALWPNTNAFAWNDHVMSDRVVAHMVLMDHLRARGLTSNDDEATFLAGLVQHADQLMDELQYTSSTNHGMIQNAALLAVAIGYPEFDCGRRWRNTAVARTTRYVQESFSKNGVCLELTPYYHWFNTQLLLWFVATCHEESIPIDPLIERTARQAVSFCRELLQPDRSLPMIADTPNYQTTLDYWPIDALPKWPEITELQIATAHVAAMPNEPGAHLWPESGYFILRNGAPNWTPDSALMLVFKTTSKSRAHSHFDALSFVLYANGQPVLNGPGYPDYNRTTDRLFIIGTQNQNTVSIDGRSQKLVRSRVNFNDVRLRARDEFSPEFVAIQGDAETYAGVQHRRTLFHGPNQTAILIIDELTSGEQHNFRQNFRMAPGCRADLDSGGFVVRASCDDRFLISIDASILCDGRPSMARPLLNPPLMAFPAKGRQITYVTVVNVDDKSAKLSIDQFRRSIRWAGPEGTLSIQLPVGASYEWSPTMTH